MLSDHVKTFDIEDSENVCVVISRKEIPPNVLIDIMREVEKHKQLEQEYKYTPKRKVARTNPVMYEYYLKISIGDGFEMFLFNKEVLNVENLIMTLKGAAKLHAAGPEDDLRIVLEENSTYRRARISRVQRDP